MSVPMQPGDANQGSNFYEQTPESRPERAKGKKAGLIAGASVLTLALLVGGGYVASNAVNSASDKDISNAFPLDTSMFAEVDLNPSNQQKMGVVSLINKGNSFSEERDINADTDPKELFTDPFFEDLDYAQDVKPWIGDKVAAGILGDVNPEPETEPMDNAGITADEYNEMMNYESSVFPEPSAVVVYEVKDEQKALDAANKAFTTEDDEKFITRNGYLIIASSDKALEEYENKMDSGRLSDNQEFNEDKKLLDIDAIATGWADFEKAGVDSNDANYLGILSSNSFNDGEEKPVKGRIISGITLTSDNASSVTKVIGLEAEGYSPDNISNATGFNDIQNLPGDSTVVLGFTGLDESARAAWDQNADNIEGSSMYTDVEEGLAEYGVKLPEDFTRLLGFESSVGIYTASQEGKEFGGTARLDGADLKLWEEITSDEISDMDEVVTMEDNGVTILSYNGSTDGTLNDNENFKKVVGKVKEAQVVGYVDLDALAEMDDEEGKDYGHLGLNASHNKEENVTDITVKWLF